MRFAALVALLLLSACQPVPHPFDQDRPPPNSDVLTPPDSAGVVVEPIAGAPEPTAHDLAAAMAAALQQDDVPASTSGGNRGSYRLSGTATTKDVGGGNLLINIAWEMRDASGLPASRQDSTLTLPDRRYEPRLPPLVLAGTSSSCKAAAMAAAKSCAVGSGAPAIGSTTTPALSGGVSTPELADGRS